MKRTNGKALSVNNAKRRIGINARRVITLTLSNIALQALGFVYRMMLTDCAGTTALGLQSLVMQIYSIAVSVCISGLNVAVITVAARLNAAGGRGIRTLTRCALLAFCVLFLLSAVPSFILRRSIALRLIGDCKTEGAIPLVLICIFLTGTENILKSVHIAAGTNGAVFSCLAAVEKLCGERCFCNAGRTEFQREAHNHGYGAE
mgnify:CR=1 FL=1